MTTGPDNDPSKWQYYGPNCTGSEMGHIWYTELGNKWEYDGGGKSVFAFHNTGPFTFDNVSLTTSTIYWSGSEYVLVSSNVWVFGVGDGTQIYLNRDLVPFYAVAVRPGDVYARSVPEPSAFSLLLAGLGALTLAWRRSRSRRW